jgi:hypothetical protein
MRGIGLLLLFVVGLLSMAALFIFLLVLTAVCLFIPFETANVLRGPFPDEGARIHRFGMAVVFGGLAFVAFKLTALVARWGTTRRPEKPRTPDERYLA